MRDKIMTQGQLIEDGWKNSYQTFARDQIWVRGDETILWNKASNKVTFYLQKKVKTN